LVHTKRRAAVVNKTSSLTRRRTSHQQGQATSGTVQEATSGSPLRGSKLYGTRLYLLDEIQHAPTDEVLPYTPLGAAAEISKPEPSSSARLVVVNGSMRGRQFRLKDNFTIGSTSDCDLMLGNDDTVAGCSAKVCLENDRYYIYQLGNRTDTLLVVNDVGAQRQELRDRDEIQIGKTIMLFIQQEGVRVATFSELSAEDLTVEAKRRLLEFDSIWDRLTSSVRHD
jgi:type III secretion system (T3SS) inner membrane Yop/YscD-like protein